VRDGRDILSNAVFSQVATHLAYGGVVPELASREHVRAIAPIVRRAIEEAGTMYADLHAIAVTQGPGLAGALLVGITFAKALAYGLDKPLIAVNHIEGHIHAVLLELAHAQVEPEYPILALVVSGGHTHLYVVERNPDAGLAYRYRPVGRTLDDAAGEAFDKVAKLLGLPYPGGPVIDALARHGNPNAVKFALSQVKEKIYREPRHAADEQTAFSFSGIKTAVLRYVELNPDLREGITKRQRSGATDIDSLLAATDSKTLDLIASFQHAVVSDLMTKTMRAAERHEVRSLLVTGGVAAISALRERFTETGSRRGYPVYFPSRSLSTDNAAMIAAAAFPKLTRNDFADVHFSAEPSLLLR
jgi:N6-L-threonylcarbamoyladenine synthase